LVKKLRQRRGKTNQASSGSLVQQTGSIGLGSAQIT